LHGDLGRIVKDDVVLAVSHSGESPELLVLLPSIKRLGIALVSLTGNPRSTLASASDASLDVGVRKEACPLGLAPTASTTAALAMGDALGMALLDRRGFTVEDFAVLHPGGQIGRKLVRIEDVMHAGDQVPLVRPGTLMKDVLFEMTRKRLGMTTVADESGRLLGVVSDGDLRRLMERHGPQTLALRAEECMTRAPVTIAPREISTRALDLMESRRITSLVVVDERSAVLGVVHLHDLWETEMI